MDGNLAQCPVKNGFRLRGHAMTRTETFTDAAFAFAVTMLVISIDAVPESFDEMIAALREIPAFLLSFALLMMFWSGHWRWSRRFGLEDFPSVTLSLLLVFCILVYVYLLKYQMSLFTAWITGGALSPRASLQGPQQLYTVFVVYGTAWIVTSSAIYLLNRYALTKREILQLNAVEEFETRTELQVWLIMIAVGTASVALALFTSPIRFAPPGFCYMALSVIMPIHAIKRERLKERLASF